MQLAADPRRGWWLAADGRPIPTDKAITTPEVFPDMKEQPSHAAADRRHGPGRGVVVFSPSPGCHKPRQKHDGNHMNRKDLGRHYRHKVCVLPRGCRVPRGAEHRPIFCNTARKTGLLHHVPLRSFERLLTMAKTTTGPAHEIDVMGPPCAKSRSDVFGDNWAWRRVRLTECEIAILRSWFVD